MIVISARYELLLYLLLLSYFCIEINKDIKKKRRRKKIMSCHCYRFVTIHHLTWKILRDYYLFNMITAGSNFTRLLFLAINLSKVVWILKFYPTKILKISMNDVPLEG